MSRKTEQSSLWPVQVFFDGACPMCSREAKHYQKRDVHGRIEFVDIASPQFDATAYGLNPVRVTEVMHARTADGCVHTELEAFRQLWRALPASFISRVPLAILAIPGAIWFFGKFYRLFARNRYRLAGRCTPESCTIQSPP